jgi:hypothetical protein
LLDNKGLIYIAEIILSEENRKKILETAAIFEQIKKINQKMVVY